MTDRWHADALVIFGITGDLAQKMTFPALYRMEQRGLINFPIIGVASSDLTTDQLVGRARKSIDEAATAGSGAAPTGGAVSDAIFDRLARRFRYLSGDANTPELYERIGAELGAHRRPLFYLETPPALFAPISEQLAAARLTTQARVALEKPFGHDLASARQLDNQLRQVLDEDQILRVDHFLAKEPVIEVEYLRFANLAMAQLWDRDSVAAIQITMAERLGVAERSAFYDRAGALRDVIQNHLLQVLALVTMDPPVGSDSDDLWDKKAEVLRAIPAADTAHYVRGQYAGYLGLPGVDRGSTTETYAAVRLMIDNWRWAGVPILIRAGKELPVRATEVRLILREPPRPGFLPDPSRVPPNQIVLRIDPDPGMRLQISALDRDVNWRNVALDCGFAHDLGQPLPPYERLLLAALTGDNRYFARQDAIEESWRIVQPLVSYPPPVQPYPAGSWGPAAADQLTAGGPPWQLPWLP